MLLLIYAAFVILSVLPIVEVLTRKRRDRSVAHPANGLWVVFVYFGVLQPASSLDSWIGTFGVENVLMAELAFALSGAFIVLGLRSRTAARIASAVPPIAEQLSPKRLRLLGFACLLIGAMAICYLAFMAGGIEE